VSPGHQTLAAGLNDSPAGLAAWIVEKFRAWSDCDGDLEKCFSKDEILTNIMIYWVT
jgi:epoxide hydrolase